MKKLDFIPDKFISGMYGSYRSPFEGVCDKESFLNVANKVSTELAELLAIDTIPNKIEDIKPYTLFDKKRNGYTVQKTSVEICKDWKMLCYVLKPDKPSGKGVVAVCGHGFGCRQIFRQSKSGAYRHVNFLDNYQKNFGEALAKCGNIVLVFEPIGFGEARLSSDLNKPFYISSCRTISCHTLLYGLTTASLRVYQAKRCIDLLLDYYGCTEANIMGISGGGLVSLYTSCIDSRINKTVVCGYVNTFKDSILSRWHCADNYIPNILKVGEIYDIASAIAPRKLLTESGARDRLFPVSASKTAIEKITAAYEAANATDCYFPIIFNGKHEVELKAALDFLNK